MGHTRPAGLSHGGGEGGNRDWAGTARTRLPRASRPPVQRL